MVHDAFGGRGIGRAAAERRDARARAARDPLGRDDPPAVVVDEAGPGVARADRAVGVDIGVPADAFPKAVVDVLGDRLVQKHRARTAKKTEGFLRLGHEIKIT